MTHTIDLHFLNQSHAIASFLVETSEGPVLMETGPYSTLPSLREGVNQSGYKLSDIKHVFLTHIHLDHAGAAWSFAEQGAKIYLHPFGLNHMADPAKLMESASRIYGDKMDELWGQMKKIDKELLISVDNNDSINVGNTSFISHHTPGHARHHIAWQVGEELFSGDVAGVKIGDGPVVPPCPPPDINIEDWSDSIELIRKINPKKIHLTHFGAISDINNHLDQLELMIKDWGDWIYKRWKAGGTVESLTPKFSAYTKDQLIHAGVAKEDTFKYEAANPSWMSVAGLIRYWKRRENS